MSKNSGKNKDFPTPIDQQTEGYWKELNKIIDPEVGIGLVDLGLIYSVEIDEEIGLAKVIMTLTSPMCPVGPVLAQQVQDKMRMYQGVEDVELDVVFEPVWNSEMINPDVRDLMF